MVPQENLGLGEIPKELNDSQVEEPDPLTDLESGTCQLATEGHSSRRLNPKL